MARLATGWEHIEAVRKLLKPPRTADELRLSQSVLFAIGDQFEHEAARRVLRLWLADFLQACSRRSSPRRVMQSALKPRNGS